MIKVSIIVPIYNSEIYIEKCLQSLLNQTLKEIEIILIDDGSTDNSSKICDIYAKKDSRIRVFHKKNEGQGIARNIGISLAQGKFIGFIDSDDYVDYNFYKKLYDSAISYNADVACGNIVKIFPDNTEESYGLGKYLTEKRTLIEDINEKRYLIYTDLFYDKIIKKDLFEKFNIKFNEIGIFEDTPVGIMIALSANKITFIPDVKYYYVQQKESTMHNMSSKTLKIFNLLYAMHEKINLTFYNLKDFNLYQQILYMRDFRQLFFFIFSTEKFRRNKILKLSKKYLKEYEAYYNKKYSNFDIDARIFIIKHSPNAFVFMNYAYLYYLWIKIIMPKFKNIFIEKGD